MPIQYESPANTVGYLPEPQRCTAYYLFSRAERYLCRMKQMDLRSVEHIRFFGTPTAGDPYYDLEMRNEMVDRLLTIAEMACYFRDGIAVRVANRADTKKIYERITDHLVAWRAALNALNHPRPPLEDLITLDEFAHKVYEHAKWHFKDPYTTSLLEMTMRNRFGGNALFGNTTQSLPTIENPPPARETFNDLFVGHRKSSSSGMPAFSLNGPSNNPYEKAPVSGSFALSDDTNDTMQFSKRFGGL